MLYQAIFSCIGALVMGFPLARGLMLLIFFTFVAAAFGWLIGVLRDELRALGSTSMVVAGGVIPQSDHEFLHDAGVRQVFGPGTRIPGAARTIIADLAADLAAEEDQAAA